MLFRSVVVSGRRAGDPAAIVAKADRARSVLGWKPTRDGTCVRDYIQVTDLIDAHLNALAYLRAGGASVVCNCGYEHGETVKEVVEVVKRVSGIDFPVVVSGRRAGDPAAIVAKAERARSVLGWKPSRDNLDEIVRQALDWERRLHNRSTEG